MDYMKQVYDALEENQGAITALFNQTINMAMYITSKLVEEKEDVFDTVQKSYTDAFTNLAELKEPTEFDGWLYRIVLRNTKEYLENNAFSFSSLSSRAEKVQYEFEDFRDSKTIRRKVKLDTLKKSIQKVLNSLSNEEILCFFMYYIGDGSVSEIAQSFECTENTVKNHLCNAQEKIFEEVIDLEKSGTNLFSLNPVSFFIYILKQSGESKQIELEETVQIKDRMFISLEVQKTKAEQARFVVEKDTQRTSDENKYLSDEFTQEFLEAYEEEFQENEESVPERDQKLWKRLLPALVTFAVVALCMVIGASAAVVTLRKSDEVRQQYAEERESTEESVEDTTETSGASLTKPVEVDSLEEMNKLLSDNRGEYTMPGDSKTLYPIEKIKIKRDPDTGNYLVMLVYNPGDGFDLREYTITKLTSVTSEKKLTFEFSYKNPDLSLLDVKVERKSSLSPDKYTDEEKEKLKTVGHEVFVTVVFGTDEIKVSTSEYFPSKSDGMMKQEASKTLKVDDGSYSQTKTEPKTETQSTAGPQMQETTETQPQTTLEKTDGYLLPTSNTKLLTEADVSSLSADEFSIARNEIYARHGRIFKDPVLKKYFESQSWYEGTVKPENFDENVLSDIERANVNFLLKYPD